MKLLLRFINANLWHSEYVEHPRSSELGAVIWPHLFKARMCRRWTPKHCNTVYKASTRQPARALFCWEGSGEFEFPSKYLRPGFFFPVHSCAGKSSQGYIILKSRVRWNFFLVLQMRVLNLTFRLLSELSHFNYFFSGGCIYMGYNK